MSMLNLDPSSLPLSLTLGLALSLTACQVLPKQPHLLASQQLSARVNALYHQDNGKLVQNMPTSMDKAHHNQPVKIDLVSAISAQKDIHPDLSGYHPIVTGANAFASRSILTSMAAGNIDAQYYIWHDDQAGQLLLKDLWEAAERGVIVRLLLDDFNNSGAFDQHLLRFSSHPNIAVRIINPLMHRKFQALNFVTGLPRINRRMLPTVWPVRLPRLPKERKSRSLQSMIWRL